MRYAEDLPVGTAFPLGERQLTEDEIVAFAREWDPQPFHIDPEAAAATAFGGVIASGVQTIAVAQRLLFDAFFADTAVIAGLGVDEVRLPRPVRASTVISGRVEIVGQRLLDDGRGVITYATTLTDQDGAVLLSQRTAMMVHRQPVAS